jgi:ethanolamine utilization protein EutN
MPNAESAAFWHLPFAIWHLGPSLMILAKVIGTVVATRKDERLLSTKLLVARPVDPSGKTDGGYLVAVDTVDAGFGETVLIVSGSSARMASGLKDCPVDAAIVGIVDNVEVKE